jgi:hypothetical protein
MASRSCQAMVGMNCLKGYHLVRHRCRLSLIRFRGHRSNGSYEGGSVASDP